LVLSRTRLINHVRSAVKTVDERLPNGSAESFAKQSTDRSPEALRPALSPLLDTIEDITGRIHSLEKQIKILSQQRYPETQRPQQVMGVGPITAFIGVLALEDPGRFAKIRGVKGSGSLLEPSSCLHVTLELLRRNGCTKVFASAGLHLFHNRCHLTKYSHIG
jgi:hypothetical protein